MGVRSLTALLVVTVMTGQGEGVEDLIAGPSSLHYSYENSYGYTDLHSPYHGYKHKYGHHQSDLGKTDYINISLSTTLCCDGMKYSLVF